MVRRRTIGDHPLDALVAPPPVRGPRDRTPRRVDARPTPPARPPRSVRATFHLPAALVEDAKNAVVALAGPPLRLTLAALVREALTRELARLQKAHYQGKPWPRRAAPLVGGRPLST